MSPGFFPSHRKPRKEEMDKREFILWMALIVSVVLLTVGIVEHAFELAENGKNVQRARIEVCKSVNDDGLKVLCIEHARSN